ncbi:MAG: hypothetical protein O7I42_25995 [Alphaproteobacteria bacterium]|nr:hypothetical protein [Alphaproteobacteria bacterium]
MRLSSGWLKCSQGCLHSARTLAAAAAIAALSSCASGPDYAAYLDRWSSATKARLVADWGPPDHRYGDLKGRPTLQYAYHEVLFESLSSDRRVVWWCLTNFHLDRRGRVAATSLSGNHCFPPDNLAADRARRRAGRSLPTLPPSD